MNVRAALRCLGALFLLYAIPHSLLAQQMAVPVDVQLPIFLKILTFERNFAPRYGDQVVFGVLYRKQARDSVNVKESLVQAISRLKDKTEDGFHVRSVPIDLDRETDLAKSLEDNGVSVLYVTPLSLIDIQKITSISRARKLMTLSGVPEFAERGLSVSIGLKRNKPLIIVNLTAAQAEGANLSSQLLELSEVIP